jgi:hypothetical protein
MVVLADRLITKRVRAPELTPIEQRRPAQPGPATALVAVFPGACAVEFAEIDAARSAQRHARLRQQRVHLAAEAVGGVPVVVVAMGDVFARAAAQAKLRLAPRLSPGGQAM